MLAGHPVGGERIAKDDVADVLPFDEHVRLADGIRLGVQLLPMHHQAGVGVERPEVLAGHAEHAARSGRRIVEGAHHAGLRKGVVVLDEEEIDHEPNDLTRREVLSGGLVRKLGKLANQLFEYAPHRRVGHGLGVKVYVRELLADEVEQPRFLEPVHLSVKLEPLEDVAHGPREALHVRAQVFPRCGPGRRGASSGRGATC